MAGTATAPVFDSEQFERVKHTYGFIGNTANSSYLGYSTNTDETPCSVESISMKIDETVNDADQYADGEACPSESTIESLKALLRAASIPASIHPKVSVYYGEVDVTWQANGKFVRLIGALDNRPPRLYFHTESDEVLTRGHSQEANEDSLNDRLRWLMIES